MEFNTVKYWPLAITTFLPVKVDAGCPCRSRFQGCDSSLLTADIIRQSGKYQLMFPIDPLFLQVCLKIDPNSWLKDQKLDRRTNDRFGMNNMIIIYFFIRQKIQHHFFKFKPR